MLLARSVAMDYERNLSGVFNAGPESLAKEKPRGFWNCGALLFSVYQITFMGYSGKCSSTVAMGSFSEMA